MLTVISLLLLTLVGVHGHPPVVMYHGMGDTAYGSLNSVIKYIEKTLPGIYVTSIQIGSTVREDFLSSYFVNLNKQVEMACSTIANDPKLKNGYNGIGFSQGGQILRGIAQRCPDPPMINLITLGGQHQGVYGLPRCFGDDSMICDYVRKMINLGAYLPFVQENLVQAQYWHDPLQEELYKTKSVFLSDINNEKDKKNATYKANLLKLKNLVMVKFLNESIVDPEQSEWFEFYENGGSTKVIPLENSTLYIEDWIGLKELNESGRLKRVATLGDHLQFTLDWFHTNILQPYLQ